MADWNPWHGCQKYSEGCMHCYVYRRDASYELDASKVRKNKAFDDPIARKRDGSYKLSSPAMVYTCFTSDFFIDEADQWRADAWRMIKERSDLSFFFITKRILRFYSELPDDWGNGYTNVTIGVTCENQARADERLPFFLSLPIKHKTLICEPMLEDIDLSPYLGGPIEQVVIGGESGPNARLMRYEWAVHIQQQCIAASVPFSFKQTGANFEKDGRIYRIARNEQMKQARKSGLSWTPSPIDQSNADQT
ncbi:MAG: DUF5131 family protein [Clostridiales bacterium]|nr:DUF5131 family protein [Clostridiales bacterium]